MLVWCMIKPPNFCKWIAKNGCLQTYMYKTHAGLTYFQITSKYLSTHWHYFSLWKSRISKVINIHKFQYTVIFCHTYFKFCLNVEEKHIKFITSIEICQPTHLKLLPTPASCYHSFVLCTSCMLYLYHFYLSVWICCLFWILFLVSLICTYVSKVKEIEFKYPQKKFSAFPHYM